MNDYIDNLLGQWHREFPNLDTGPMTVISRLLRAAAIIHRSNESVFASHGLQGGRFDVLTALQRAGNPYILAPTELSRSLLITSGAMAHRLVQLERDGRIVRLPDPQDGRGYLAQITETGSNHVGAALDDLVSNEKRLLGGLTDGEREELASLLRTLLTSLGDTEAPSRTRPRSPRPPYIDDEAPSDAREITK